MSKTQRLDSFWKFMRQHSKSTHSITASYGSEGEVVFDQEKVAGQVVSKWSQVFKGQTEPVFHNSKAPYPDEIDPSDPVLKNLPKSHHTNHERFLCCPFTMSSLQKILSEMKDNKSKGFDNIPAEVLKNAGGCLRTYLLEFYNKIWKSGNVPESLNTIKCILIHKMGDSLGKYC